MSEENVTDNWDEITDTELEKRLETEKLKREQEEMNATNQNGLTILSNGSDFKPRIMQRPKEVPQKVTILKRPEATSSSSLNQQQQGSQKPQKSLEQREKEYAEARRRILGSESESLESTIKPNSSSKISPSSSSNCLPNYINFNPLQFQQPPPRIPENVIRNPRGPNPGSGFNIRR